MQRSDPKEADDRFSLAMLPSARQDRDAGKALSKIDGVYFSGGYRALMPLGEAVAELVLEVDGTICIRTAACLPSSPSKTLQLERDLPGNLRYTLDASGGALVAETQVDGAAHLPHTFRSLREAMLRSLHAATTDPAVLPPPISRDSVQQALARLPWAGEGVVEQEQGWELRPRLRGDPVPVCMAIEPAGLRLSRVVLHQLPPSGTPGAAAVADYAVRLNGSLRHARLAISDARLMAEARLDSRLVQADWLATTASAVAVAARHAGTPLRLLADQPAVADTYLTVFCSTGEQPAPAGAGG
jgi:hypothetical protein